MVQYEAAQSTSRLASTERIPRALKKKNPRTRHDTQCEELVFLRIIHKFLFFLKGIRNNKVEIRKENGDRKHSSGNFLYNSSNTDEPGISMVGFRARSWVFPLWQWLPQPSRVLTFTSIQIHATAKNHSFTRSLTLSLLTFTHLLTLNLIFLSRSQ